MNRVTDDSYKSIVYISHPYGGDSHNKQMIEEIIIGLQRKYPEYLFVSPVHTFCFLYDKVQYQQGIDMCLWLLENCDEMWVFGDWTSSKGCEMEVDYCQKYNIPFKHVDVYNELQMRLDHRFQYRKKCSKSLLPSDINALNACLHIPEMKYCILEQDNIIHIIADDKYNTEYDYRILDEITKIEDQYYVEITLWYDSEFFLSNTFARRVIAILDVQKERQ